MTSFLGTLKNVWNGWKLRSCILLSLFLQTFLVLFASSRKRNGKLSFILMIWLAYLLADWIAAFAIGLITKGKVNDNSCEATSDGTNQYVATFWASFLLLHLGGPDSITSFALEDNEFWIRHLFGLVVQAVGAAYNFYLTLPENNLWPPTVMIFLVGIVKYGERIIALYLASLDRFGATALPKPEPGPDYEETSTTYASKLIQVPIQAEMMAMSKTGSYDPDFDFKRIYSEYQKSAAKIDPNELQLLQLAYKLFERFKGLIVGFFLTTRDRDSSKDLFLTIENYKHAFRLIENELSFMFNILHTKAVVTHNRFAYILRLISFCSLWGALVYFWRVEKEEIGRIEKILTYVLLIGGIVLDAISVIFKLILSDLTLVVPENRWTNSVPQKYLKRKKWSKSASQYNMIDYCLDERPKWLYQFARLIHVSGLLEKIKIMWFSSAEKIPEKLEKFIFDELKEKSKKAPSLRDAVKASQQRGDYALSPPRCDFATMIKLNWSIAEFQYAESLLLWHIATEICHLEETSTTSRGNQQNSKRNWWKLLWDTVTEIIYRVVKLPWDIATKIIELLWDTATKIICCFKENSSTSNDEQENSEREHCKIISDYMFYLLVKQPNMFSTVLGSGNIVFRNNTGAETKRFFVKHSIKNSSEAVEKIDSMKAKFRPVAVKGSKSKSVFFDACILAKQLQGLGAHRWVVMERMWVELMCYAAINCRPIIHAQQPSKGGELLTFTWLLMNHFGLGIQFSEQEELAGANMTAVK